MTHHTHARVLIALLFCTLPLLAQQDLWAVRLTGGGIMFPHNPIMLTQATVTLEAWARVYDWPQFSSPALLDRWTNAFGLEHKGLFLNANGSIGAVYLWQPYITGNSPAGSVPSNPLPHHIAFVRHAIGNWECFVDGQVVLSTSAPCPLYCVFDGAPNATGLGMHPGDGTPSFSTGMDVLAARWSSVDRYSGPFVPQHVWTPDAQTCLLAQLEEGTGSTVFDSGPAAQIGMFQGTCTWVLNSTACSGANAALLCAPANISLPGPYNLILSSAMNNAPLFVFADTLLASNPLGPGGIWGTTQIGFSPMLVALADPTSTFGPTIGAPTTNASGDWSLVLQVPNIPGIAGLTYHAEAYVMSFAAPNGLFFQSNLASSNFN